VIHTAARRIHCSWYLHSQAKCLNTKSSHAYSHA